MLKGTTAGTVTDVDGNYKISVPAEGGTLVFSFIGLTTSEIGVGTRSTIDVQMAADITQLSEIVVTGYSAVKKSNLTSAITTVKGEGIQSQPIGGIDNLLQGKSPGVIVTNQNGQPGAQAYIRIRGIGSVNASNEPLFIIDGNQMEASEYNAINPNDIEEISILKDAASTSIYGARASNGVVLVTTKRGSKQTKPQITYRYQYGTKERIKDNFDLMNKEQKLQYELEVGYKTQAQVDALRSSLAAPETDWSEVLLRKGTVQQHDLSFSGNTDKSRYFFSFGTYNEEGIVISSDFNRLTGRINAEFDVTKKLTIGNTLTVSNTTSKDVRDRNNVQNPFNAVYSYLPWEPEFVLNPATGDPILDSNGDPVYNLTRQGFSISEALKNNPENLRTLNTIGSYFIQYKPMDGLTLKSTIGANYQVYRRDYYVQPGSVLDGYVGDPLAPGSKTDNGHDRFQYNWTNTANYNFKVADLHNIDVLVGTEFIKRDLQSFTLSSKGFPSKKFVTQNNASAIVSGNTARTQWSLWSQFGQVSYNMNEKYFATASLRRDGSSRFGADNKFGTFWSASAGWNAHEESFLSGIDLIEQLKLRASVGTSGNVPDQFYAAVGLFGFGGYNNQNTSVPTQLENRDLKWESNFNYGVGIDFGILDNKLSGAIDYYSRNTSDLLFNRPISRTTGFNSRLENIGEIQNTGIELELSYDLIRATNFNLTLNGSFSTNSNKVLNLQNGGEDIINGNSGISVLREGEKLNSYYLVRYAGVDAANGDPLYLTGEGQVTNVWNGDDAVLLKDKSPLPTYFGNFGINADYKGIRLTTTFYYQGGNYIYNYQNEAVMMADGGSSGRGNQRVDALNFWKNPGDVGVLPRPAVTNVINDSDRYLQKGDFIRLRNVQLSYSLPSTLVRKAKLQAVEVYVQATNLWTYNPHFSGDPEVGRGSDESNLTLLGEFTLFTYPNTKGLTCGVNIKL
ncbi:TonB-dependent receptor [Chryseotalea sanaruensis]|uniref:TonB-dependent receptor n=1 Tax=Chryseotalea sanaruensis TaxID=2482724 RepID=A0A401UBI8_9BACT|nr:TonB-dependent receptor [Chryseotalea sanaruensis]